MSLKERLKPYIFSFGLICSLFSFSNVFAAPLGVGIAPTITQNQYGYLMFVQIPSDLFSTSDCGYESGTIWYSMKSFYNSSDDSYTQTALALLNESYTTIQNQGYLETQFGLGFPSLSAGNYYAQIYPSGAPHSTYDSCGNPAAYIYLPIVVDEYGSITAGSTTPPDIDGVCGPADGTLPSTIPIPDGDACSSGTVSSMHDYYSFDGIIFDWSCLGSGNGISVTCESLPFPESTDGVCGSADGGSSFNEPDEEDKCSAGSTGATTTITLTGWSWTCFGLYGGNDVTCSSTYSGGGTPPEDIETYPVPTPTDCESYSGIDQIFCNFGNIIQGLFLPSTSKLIELQNTLNSVGNVFPFNYLRAIGSVFSNTTISEGSLTLTMFGTTETINPAFWTLPIFSNFKLFATILILLMFTFWAINYIKHFFK